MVYRMPYQIGPARVGITLESNHESGHLLYLDMNFEKIEVSDIKDKDERDAMSVGVHVSVGGSYGTDSGLRGPDPSEGSTDIAFSNGGTTSPIVTSSMLPFIPASV